MASPSEPQVLIAAQSARALAQAARASGYAPLVADLYGDDDTRAAAAAFEPWQGDPGAALKRLSKGRAPAGLVYGAGFEADPRVLAKFNILGNGPDTITRLKSPIGFAKDCAGLGIPHPDVQLSPPRTGGDWLSKTAGASGGDHILAGVGAEKPGRYYQRFVDGMPVSALFLGDGQDTQIVGFSRQWCAPTAELPFRYGGAAQPAGIAEGRLAPLAEAARKLTKTFGLKGLNSADFIVAEEGWWLLEVNPRPGATLDVFGAAIPDLFTRHIKACAGEFLPLAAPPSAHTAHAIVYASQAIASVPKIVWPEWAFDRQRAGTPVAKDAPLCSVRATGATAMDAIAATTARIHLMRAQLERRAA